jgi:hypothetical protein
MELGDIVKLAGQGGVALIVLGAFIWLIRTVGLSMVAEIKALGAKVDEHTKVDLAHHAKVSEELAELSGRIEGIAFERERTPVETPIPMRPQSRVVAGTTYSIPRRAPTRDEEK